MLFGLRPVTVVDVIPWCLTLFGLRASFAAHTKNHHSFHADGSAFKFGSQTGKSSPRAPNGQVFAQGAKRASLRPGRETDKSSPRERNGQVFAQGAKRTSLRPGSETDKSSPRERNGQVFAQGAKRASLRQGSQAGKSSPREPNGQVLAVLRQRSSPSVTENTVVMRTDFRIFSRHVGLPWLPFVGLRPSCLDGCLFRFT